MNKGERNRIKKQLYKKRLKLNGISENDTFRGIYLNRNAYRTTGKPCSCISCSPGKIEEKAKYRDKLNKGKNKFGEQE